jgi:hypothetical protein
MKNPTHMQWGRNFESGKATSNHTIDMFMFNYASASLGNKSSRNKRANGFK